MPGWIFGDYNITDDNNTHDEIEKGKKLNY